MRSLPDALAVLMALIASLPACRPAQQSLSESSTGLRADKAVYDFGFSDQKESITHTFRLHNAGDRQVTINSFRQSCGCTSVKADRNAVAPGENAQVVVSIDLSKKKGSVNETVAVVYDDPDIPPLVLALHGTTDPPELPCFQPVRIHFGTLGLKEQQTHKVAFQADQCPGIQVTGVDSTDRDVQATWSPAESAIVVTAHGERAGPHQHEIQVSLEGPQRRVVSIPVAWLVENDFDWTPKQVFLGNVAVGEEKEAEIVLTSASSPLELDLPTKEIKAQCGQVKARLIQSAHHQSAAIRVTFHATAKGIFSEKITAEYNRDRQRQVTIPIVAFCR